MNTKQKFESIDQDKLSASQKEILLKIKSATKDFTIEDEKSIQKVDMALDNIIDKLKKTNPEAIKGEPKKEEPKDTEKKDKKSRTKTPKSTTKRKKTKTPEKGKRTIFSVAKEIRKADESWEDAKERAKKLMGKEKEETTKKMKTETEKLLAFIKRRKELEGLSGTTISKDSKIQALPKGRRISKNGKVYYENRDNRTDRLAPSFEDKIYLADGGSIIGIPETPLARGLDIDYTTLVGETGALSSGEMFAKGGGTDSKLEAGVYRVGKPIKVRTNLYAQKIVEIFDNGNIATASDYARSLSDFKSMKYPTISKEQLDSMYMYGGNFFKKGGALLTPRERYVAELKGLTGLRQSTIDDFIDENNLTNEEILNIVIGLGRRQINAGDVSTAIVGTKNNPEFKKLMTFAKSDKALRAYKGGGRVVNVVNEGENYDMKKYQGIFGDYDGDGVTNVNDLNPLDKSKVGKVDNIEIDQTFKKLIDLKNDLDVKMYEALEELDKKSPKNAEFYARTKTPFSIVKKLVDKRLLDPKKGLTDLIGTTVVVSNQNELEKVKKDLDKGLMGEVLDFDDFYKNPNNGYRAYHYIVMFKGIPIEIQLKTKMQKQLNEVSHEFYKKGTLNAKGLNEVSEMIMKADKGDKEALEKAKILLNNESELAKKISVESYKNGGGMDSVDFYEQLAVYVQGVGSIYNGTSMRKAIEKARQYEKKNPKAEIVIVDEKYGDEYDTDGNFINEYKNGGYAKKVKVETLNDDIDLSVDGRVRARKTQEGSNKSFGELREKHGASPEALAFAQGGSLGNHGLKQGDQIIKTMSGGVQKVKTRTGDIVYVNLANGYRGAEPPLPFDNGGGVSYKDLFEDYSNQPKELSEIVSSYMEKFEEGDYDYEDSKNFLAEVEAIGYTFDYGLDNEPYALRPIGVKLSQVEGYEDSEDDEDEYFDKGGRTRERKYVNHSQDYEVRYSKDKPSRSGYTKPKMSRTQFEEETFEFFDNGGEMPSCKTKTHKND